MPPAWVVSVVSEYMRWAMRIARPERNRELQAMAAWLATQRTVRITPLDRYIGRAPTPAFEIEEVRQAGPKLRETVGLIRRNVQGHGRVESLDGFARALRRRTSRGAQYHLWALRGARSRRFEGAASFFCFSTIGFGGYLVLSGKLRNKGLLRPLIARIEERMLRDSSRATGWLIEVGSESIEVFSSVGFQEIAKDYSPPRVGSTRMRVAEPERLHLLYKPFGSVHAPNVLSRKAVLDGIAAILEHVYGVDRPRQHPCYKRVLKAAREARA